MSALIGPQAPAILRRGPDQASFNATPLAGSSGLRVPDRAVAHSAGNLSSIQVIPGKSPNRNGKNPRVWLPGFYCNNLGSSPTELIIANQFKVKYALGVGTGAANKRRKATFRGAESVTRGGPGSLYGYGTPYDWGVVSDVIREADGADFLIPANSDLLHCSITVTSAAAHVFPSQISSAATVTGNVSRSSAVSDFSAFDSFLTSTGTISNSGNGPAGYGPIMMVMEDTDSGELFSFLLTGDSRFWGVGDFSSGIPATYNARGMQSGARAMVTLGAAYANISMSGSNPGSDVTHRYAGISAFKALYGGKSPFTHTLSNHGNNGSLTSNITLIQSERSALAALLGPGAKHGKATIPPRIGTGGDYRTPLTQAPDAQDQYPSGARAALNDFILANVSGGSPIWDFVIDVGLYGSAAKGVSVLDPNYNALHSAFPVRGTTVLGANWTNNSTIIMADQTVQIGDVLSVGSTFVRGNIMGPVRSGPTAVGDGTYSYLLEIGSFPNTTYTLGDPVTIVATGDGTHEGPWVSVLESQAITEWYAAGRPARYPIP